MSGICEFISDLISVNYPLGKVSRTVEIKQGDTNNSYFTYVQKDGREQKWYVRQYHSGETEAELRYEHAFEKYFSERHGDAIDSPVPVENNAGGTWVKASYDGTENYYAVFNVVTGKEAYSWEFNDLTPRAFDSCAVIVAQFQTWSCGFKKPEGSGIAGESMLSMFDRWRRDLKGCFEGKTDPMFRRFNEYFKKELPFFLDMIDFMESETRKFDGKLPVCINHGDLNPGNVMFDDEDRVCCVFDLDWVAENLRLYDICWMGYQIIASWDVHSWGAVPTENLRRFLEIYDRQIEEMHSPLGVLTDDERKFLPAMMMIGVAKVIMDFACYEDHRGDEYRLFVNTWRFMESLRYIYDHYEEILSVSV